MGKEPVPSVGMSWVEMAGVSARLDPVMLRLWRVKNMGITGFNFQWWFGKVYILFTVFFTVFDSCPELLIATKQLEYELCAVLARVRSSSVRLCNGIYGEKNCASTLCRCVRANCVGGKKLWMNELGAVLWLKRVGGRVVDGISESNRKVISCW